MNTALQKGFALAFLAVILALVNDLAARIPIQWDLTREKFFTLSGTSIQLVRQAGPPIQVELYFSSSRKGLPIGLKVFAHRVEQLLRQYEQQSNGRLSVKVIDPAPGSPEEEEAQRLGLSAHPLGPDERLYFGLAVFQGGNRRTVPLIDHRRERLLEYDVSSLLQAVQLPRLPKLAVASSLEVFGKRGMPTRLQKIEDGTAEWQFVRDLRLGYELEEVMPDAETLPADAEALLVINPAGFDPRLLHAIDQFILSGRPAVIALDPYCYFEIERDATDGMVIGEQYHKSSELPDFLRGWGVRLPSGEVVADLGYPTEVPVRENQAPIPFPLWLSITGFDDAQPVTAGFDLVMLAQTGFIEPEPGGPPNVNVTPLLRSTRHSAPVRAAMAEEVNPYRLAESIQPTGEIYTLAAIIEGLFPTSFPLGKPPAPPDAGSSAGADPWDLGLETSSETSRVILIADADLLKDEMAYEFVSRHAGHIAARPRNNNTALIHNSLDYLSGNSGMARIRAKERTIRPFARMHHLRRDAEEAFRREVQSINARVAQLDEELAGLNRQAAQGGNALVSDKAINAIRRVRKEQKMLQARRMEIQQQLQQSIAGLERRLTAINLAAVPALVGLSGIGFWLVRTRRRKEP